MPSGHDEGDERFARVRDERDATGRLPRPDRAERGAGDELARDRDLAAALRAAGRSVPGPDPETSARMRAAVMAEIAGTPSTATSERTRVLRTPDTGPAGGRGAGRAGASTRRAGTHRGSARPADARPAGPHPGRPGSRRAPARLVSSLVTAACTILLLGALTVVLSRGALPGEMLYGIKRASESAAVALTSGQEATGLKHLEFAATRLEEVSDLVQRSGTTAAGPGPVAAGLGPEEAALVLDNLRSFDEQARVGSRLILPLSSRPNGPSPAELAEWARSQSARLDTLSPSLDTDGRTAASDSQKMLQRLGERASALGGPTPCATDGGSDDLGPMLVANCDPTSAASASGTAASTASSTARTSSTTSTTTTTTTTTTSSEDPTPSRRDTDESSSSSPSTASSRGPRTTTPAPVQVPLPVPLLPQVDVPPLLPGLPGLSLG